MSRVVVVVPARMGSTRFPGKALADLGGAPLVVRTAELALRMETADTVLVATDDSAIRDAVTTAGFEAVLTGEHPSGSDRVGEAVAGRDADIVINLQGDEPLLDPADLDALVRVLDADSAADVATLGHSFADEAEWRDPNAVKALCGDDGAALYFSRAPLPGEHPGGDDTEPWRRALRHVGVYAYRAGALTEFLAAAPTDLERREGLEQLRALELGLRLRVVEITRPAVGVDTPEDLERVREIWAAR